MITLSVLAVVMALSMVLLGYFNEVKSDADNTKALIQGNVYYADVLKQFEKLKDKKSIFTRLYLEPLALYTDNGRFTLTLSCKPLSAGINLNWFAMERVTKKSHLFAIVQELFEFLDQAYKIEDIDRLLALIYLEVGHIENNNDEESQRRLIQKNGIISYKQFSEIIKRYEMEVDDQRVSKIPWQEYLSFAQKSEKIDAEYSSIALISFLFDLDIRSVREWKYSRNKPSLSTFVNNNGGDYNTRKNVLASGAFLAKSHCSVDYGSGYKFTFDYIEGGAKYFEFHGKN
ncbi:hypothetical protein MNB_SV-13-774 [hydrothermal vent metagenome]|uniref:Uncharacterized protein n=1 Tax=hydrothermal vent metagenome TaxID=652676 RepID=A0A1W1CZT6_9ZZZZ